MCITGWLEWSGHSHSVCGRKAPTHDGPWVDSPRVDSQGGRPQTTQPKTTQSHYSICMSFVCYLYCIISHLPTLIKGPNCKTLVCHWYVIGTSLVLHAYIICTTICTAICTSLVRHLYVMCTSFVHHLYIISMYMELYSVCHLYVICTLFVNEILEYGINQDICSP